MLTLSLHRAELLQSPGLLTTHLPELFSFLAGERSGPPASCGRACQASSGSRRWLSEGTGPRRHRALGAHGDLALGRGAGMAPRKLPAQVPWTVSCLSTVPWQSRAHLALLLVTNGFGGKEMQWVTDLGSGPPPAPEDRWMSFPEQQDMEFESPNLMALMRLKKSAGGRIAGEGRPCLLLGVCPSR